MKKRKTAVESGSTNTSVTRRDFIAIGSAAVAGLAATDLHAQARRASSNAQQRAVSIGFRGGLPAVARRRAPGAPFENAFALTNSDPAFLRAGARVSVRGLSRPSAERSAPRHIEVNQIFRDGSQAVPFFAWTLTTQRGRTSASSPVSYTVPVEVDQSIDIEVVHGTSAADASRSMVSLSPIAAAGKVMLNPGTYIVALGDGPAAPVPDWGRVSMRSGMTAAKFSGAVGLIDVDGAAPTFDYLVITVTFPAEAGVAVELEEPEAEDTAEVTPVE